MSELPVENVIWSITDGRAGLASQARGLGEALGLPVRTITVNPRFPWTWLPVTHWPVPLLADPNAVLQPPWPRIVIGCGWRSIPFSLEIKRRSNGRTTIIQLQHPRINPNRFDFVVPPEHDKLIGDNVLPMIGSPNLLTTAKLELAAANWEMKFANFKRPRLAVLIGGKSKSHRFGLADAKQLTEKLCKLVDQGFSLLVTTSRRTGEAQSLVIKSALPADRAFFWDGCGENPYLGMLAVCDAILVTSDSTNMAVEAAATGRPLYIVPLPGGAKKFDHLHHRLKTLGIAREFTGTIDRWNYEPLMETARVAAIIRKKLGLTDKIKPT